MAEHDDSHGENNYSPEQRMTALLALLVDSEAPLGPRPDLKEIQDWHLGKLDVSRAEQVKSHVARDPVCYQMWTELLAAQASAESEQTSKTSLSDYLWSRFKVWITSPVPKWGGSGLVAATAIVLAIILQPDQAGDWSPVDNPVVVDVPVEWPYLGRTTRSEGALEYDQKIALQAGLSKGIRLSTDGKGDWAQVLEYIPESPASCNDSSEPAICEAQNQILQKTGLHASVLYIACLEKTTTGNKSFNDVFWMQQTKAWESIADDLKKNNLQSVSDYAVKLSQLGEERTAQCQAVRDLINLAY